MMPHNGYYVSNVSALAIVNQWVRPYSLILTIEPIQHPVFFSITFRHDRWTLIQ
jgi:hypothetical protein